MSKWLHALLAVLRLVILVIERWGREATGMPVRPPLPAFGSYRW